MFPCKRKNVRLPRRPQGAATTQPCFCCLVSEKRQRLLYVTRNTSSCSTGWRGKERKIAPPSWRGLAHCVAWPLRLQESTQNSIWIIFKDCCRHASFKAVLGTITNSGEKKKKKISLNLRLPGVHKFGT